MLPHAAQNRGAGFEGQDTLSKSCVDSEKVEVIDCRARRAEPPLLLFQERTLVKRIKKRIPKAETPAEDNQQQEAAEQENPYEGSAEPALAGVGNDDFTRQTAKAFQWLLDHKWPIIIGVAALLVALFTVSHLQNARNRARVEATNRVMLAVKDYQAVEKPAEGEEKVTAEAREAALKKAQSSFAQAEQETSGAAVSTLAALGSAGVAVDLGDDKAAVEKYDAVMAKANLDPLLYAVALQGKAVALENQGQLDGALDTWRQLSALDAKAFGLIGDFQVARILERQSKSEDARKQYERIQKDYAHDLDLLSNRALKADIEKHLALLGEAH